nr:MAG TPA_asm: hypothetical protein [Caudoviricetes sp.]
MKNNKKASEAMEIGEGADVVIPEDVKPLEFIQKVFRLLNEWTDQEEKRGFLLIATCDSHDNNNDNTRGMAFGCNGDNKTLINMMRAALENDEDIRMMVVGACKLMERTNQ